jgi:phosphatidylglycerophosphate synthase
MLFKRKSKLDKGLELVFLSVPNNISSVLPLVASVIYFNYLVKAQYGMAFLALLGMAYNIIDRRYTRDHERNSKFRLVMNSTFDRMADIFLLAAFGFADVVSWSLVIIYLGLSYMNSYVRSRTGTVSHGKLNLNYGPMKRYIRVILIMITTVFLYMGFITFSGIYVADLMFVLMSFLSLITLVERTYLSYSKLK